MWDHVFKLILETSEQHQHHRSFVFTASFYAVFPFLMTLHVLVPPEESLSVFHLTVPRKVNCGNVLKSDIVLSFSKYFLIVTTRRIALNCHCFLKFLRNFNWMHYIWEGMFLNYNLTTSNVYDNGLVKLFGKRKLKFSSLFSQVIISRNCMCSLFFTWE